MDLPHITTTSPAPSLYSVHAEKGSRPSSPVADDRPVAHRGYSLAVPSTQATPMGSGRVANGRTLGLTRRGSRESVMSRVSNMTAASAPPESFRDVVEVYSIVAARRATFDMLLWSVPSTSFAAQAFLFGIGLDGSSSQAARIVSMGLSVVITLLTLQLFTRQLQAEAADHAWLEDWEIRHNIDERDRAHGKTWAAYRSVLPKRARHFAVLASVRGFTLWSNGMLIIGFVAFGVLVTSALDRTAFQNCLN